MVGVRNVVVKLTCLYYHHYNYTLHPSTLVALFLLRTVFSPTNTTRVSSQFELVTFLALPSLQSARESSRASNLLSSLSLVSPVNQLPRAPSVGYLAFGINARKAKFSWLQFSVPTGRGSCERSSRFTSLLCRLLHVSRCNCTSPDPRAKVHRIIRLFLHNDSKCFDF